MAERVHGYLQNIHAFLSRRLYILSWLSLVCFSVSQLFGRYSWHLELFSHFTVYYASVIMLTGLIYPKFNPWVEHPSKEFGITHRFRTVIRSTFVVVGVSLFMWCYLPSYEMIQRWYKIPDTVAKTSVTDASINTNASHSQPSNRPFIVYQNVNIANQDKTVTLSALTEHNPEILVLLEAGGEWLPHLAEIKKQYAVHCGDDQHSPFAMQVFIDNHSASCEVLSIENIPHDLPLIKVTLSPKHVLYVMHPPPPINADLAEYRLTYLHVLHELVLAESDDTEVMVIGDMNSTRFSPVYRDFMKSTDLSTTTVAGLSTWRPLAVLKVPLGIGVDHYFTTQRLTDLHRDVTPLAWYGSDHRGLLVW